VFLAVLSACAPAPALVRVSPPAVPPDSDINRIKGTPIVTLSFGEERAFRMRPWRGHGYLDVPARNGEVLIIPWDTNRARTHEVPAPRGAKGRRISVTIRSFAD
jgi:alkylated DNA repair dioxygenase AlkB